MNKNTGITIGVIALILLIGVVYISASSNNPTMMEGAMTSQESNSTNQMAESQDSMMDQPMTDSDVAMEPNSTQSESMMKADGAGMMDQADAMMKVGSYQDYSPEKVTAASADQDIVLFFRANWCPSCVGLDRDIMANLNKLPANLVILKVNYDDASELKQKYEVTYQHTFVQVDKNGQLIKKWSGSPTLARLIAEVQ